MFYVCTCVTAANQCVAILQYATYKFGQPNKQFSWSLHPLQMYEQTTTPLKGARHDLLQHNLQLSVLPSK
jgi:hypothetical protein